MSRLYPFSVSQGIHDDDSASIEQEVMLTWEEFCNMPPKDDDRSKEKHPLIYPARFEGGRRKDDNIRDLWAVRLDADDAGVDVSEEVLRASLQGLKAVAWTSFNSTPEKPRWAVFVLLESTPTKTQYKELFRRLCAIVPGVDTAQSDLSRPRVWPVDRPGFRRFVTDGAPLALPPDVPVKATTRTDRAEPMWERVRLPDLVRARALKVSSFPPVGSQYELYNLLGAVLMSVGYTSSEACSMMSDDGEYDEKWPGELERRKAIAGAHYLETTHWKDAGRYLALLGVVPYGTVAAKDLLSVMSGGSNDLLGALQQRTELDDASEALPFTRRTETGNAQLFAAMNKNKARYVSAWEKWIFWDDSKWVVCPGIVEVQTLMPPVIDVIRDRALIEDPQDDEVIMTTDAKKALDKKKEKRLGWVAKSESLSTRNATINLARSEPGMSIDHNDLDRDSWLLNVGNGTLDLRTGDLLDHEPNYLITVAAPVDYDPYAHCPRWLQFLADVTGSDAELTEYLHQVCGYLLTGQVSEQALFFLTGDGNNGKSVFTGVLAHMLGSYATAADTKLLLATGANSHPTGKASLFGKRYALVQELNKDSAWDESTVKQLTGGDIITARRMGEDFWTFAPTHKFLLCANHKPTVSGQDRGIWRRLHVIPFHVNIVNPNKNLLDELRDEELPGILSWAVTGCRAWQKAGGLIKPVCVQLASQEYKEEQDVIGRFLLERGSAVELAKDSTPRNEAFAVYEMWCLDNAEEPTGKWSFNERLARDYKVGQNAGKRVWSGLKLKT